MKSVNMDNVYTTLNEVLRLYDLPESQRISIPISKSFARRFSERKKPTDKFLPVESFFLIGLKTAVDLFHFYNFEDGKFFVLYDESNPFIESLECFRSMETIASMHGFKQDYFLVYEAFRCADPKIYPPLRDNMMEYLKGEKGNYSLLPNGNFFMLDKLEYLPFDENTR